MARDASSSSRGSGGLVFAPRQLLGVLGAKYALGGCLTVAWSALPWNRVASWHDAVTLLGLLAFVLGTVMLGLSRVALSGRAAHRLSHAFLVSAEVVVATGFAVIGDARTPVLLFLLWTTAYAGVLSRRARWAHAASATAALTVAALTTSDPLRVAGDLVFWVASIVVVTFVVSSTVDGLHRVATHDSLTRLPNRRLLQDAVTRALARRTGAGTVALALLDLDRFKDVNDTYGHAVGDALLQEVAARLRAAAGPGELVARLGGDEFAVLCEVPDGDPDLDDLARRLAGAWREPVSVGGRDLYVGGSVGVAVAGATDTPQTLLRDADAAMYQAKAAGGDRLCRYDGVAAAARERHVVVEAGLRAALARGELTVHYQPVVRLADGAPLGVEALLRWTSPELGVVGPGEFVAVAEQCGLVAQLGRFVRDRALADLVVWRGTEAVEPAFRVAVNVSPHELTEQLAHEVAAELAGYGLGAEHLALEVTESAMMTGPVPASALAGLHALGIPLLLDDFGTGHSSLTHLRRHPLSVVKIDRSFVAGTDRSDADRSLVAGVTSLAHALGATVVAEGIETAGQLREVRAAGCDAGQGFGLSRPVPAAEVPAALVRAARACRTGVVVSCEVPRQGRVPVHVPDVDADRS